MNLLKLAFLLLLHVLLKAAVACPTKDPSLKAKAYLKAYRDATTRSMLSGKPEIVQVYYADQIRFMPEFAKTRISKQQVLAYQQAFYERFTVVAYSRQETEIIELGKRIVESGSFRMVLRQKNQERTDTLEGKYLDIWEIQQEDKWKLLTEAWNYNITSSLENALRINDTPFTDVALQPHTPVTTDISFELAALNRLMETTVRQHDDKIWAQFYTHDGAFGYTGNPLYYGKKQIEAFLASHKKELPVFEVLDIRNDQIDQQEDYVIEYASHIASWRSGSYSGVGIGKDIRIWRRETNGALKIFRHFAMYD